MHPLGVEGGQIEHQAEEQAGPGGGDAAEPGTEQDPEQQIDGQPHQQGGEGGGGAPLEQLELQAGGTGHQEPVEENAQG